MIANGENISDHNGITKKDAETLHFSGVDVITTGNHAFRQKSIYETMENEDYIIRPYNLPPSAVGNGYTVQETPFGRVGVLNLIGQLYIGYGDNPFVCADKALDKLAECDYIFVDFHAEATSEKRAMGFYLDGRVSGVFGTHTHVQTADDQILEKGTAYLTDVGMTGGRNSVPVSYTHLDVYKRQSLLHGTIIPIIAAAGNAVRLITKRAA